jgi:hypothetical protein
MPHLFLKYTPNVGGCVHCGTGVGRIARAARSTSVFPFETLLAGLLIMVRAVVLG